MVLAIDGVGEQDMIARHMARQDVLIVAMPKRKQSAEFEPSVAAIDRSSALTVGVGYAGVAVALIHAHGFVDACRGLMDREENGFGLALVDTVRVNDESRQLEGRTVGHRPLL